MANDEKNEIESDLKQEFKGRNLEEVISLAEHVLKMPREKFSYEIVTEKTKLFGIKTKEIVIRAWPKDEAEENAAADFLKRLMPHFPLELEYQVKKKNDMIYLVFDGNDKNLLLRNEGALLLAFQHVLNKISPRKVQVDCEFFRKRKERRLREFAQQIAQKVQETGNDEILELMNPYERRIIHIAVNQVPGITSESLGEGFLKQVKVFQVQRQVK
ncbi:MAG TPA: R3H domain-containing nucleic acid-binding protein [Candidatus Aminicenantes bacterium]|nr:Jag N-terminal domain-containing protein [Acidobacteriota bacterium]HOI44879.1 R3H domain-containing nucleic acid-binding protein [Candidatus Aminicenantes bacterium]